MQTGASSIGRFRRPKSGCQHSASPVLSCLGGGEIYVLDDLILSVTLGNVSSVVAEVKAHGVKTMAVEIGGAQGSSFAYVLTSDSKSRTLGSVDGCPEGTFRPLGVPVTGRPGCRSVITLPHLPRVTLINPGTKCRLYVSSPMVSSGGSPATRLAAQHFGRRSDLQSQSGLRICTALVM